MKKNMSLQTSRRTLLQAGLAGLGVAAAAPAQTANGQPADDYITPAMRTPGRPFTAYGMPASYEAGVKRIVTPPGISPGTGVSRTPLEMLEGIITPSGLHYERHHNGVPDIDPAAHRLAIHGLVKTPLEFSMDALMRYPRISRMHFMECGGNSGANSGPTPSQQTAGGIHGLLSCSEWTGVALGPLLDEAGVMPTGTWLLAESGDAAGLSRSVPLAEAHAQGILALFQNGERLRPEQGYPVRLLMPGWEGNLNIKWLHRLKVTTGPMMTKDETSKYTQLQADGRARQFNFLMPVKSVITRPSGGMTMQGAGYYEISGVAWSGHGAIAKVEVSRDSGATWVAAEMPGPVLPKCLTRFRLPWDWDGKTTVLMSRATDDAGNVQPVRSVWIAQFKPGQGYQNNSIQSWQVGADNSVKNTYV
ncbi:MAG TPA: sulfite dehydrogenase [Rhizomicrobium sp.]|jgi:sulfane dehydrogenase subunit SoxC|nr:sulfite dehydrogenase [Rhizomicrobium sp.]